uniref:Negative elongation factor E n=1 Tax=Lynceus sp. MCZ IZ 141354 TaxID=1930659 RepID=A0A9N6WTI5_9CRUS|nr:EOG090X0F8Z [Lynceus sp. MCZ IZ 141354]
MVYHLHFPSSYTEEEQMLQAKYAKLRKKKKALVALRTPKPEVEKSSLPTKRPHQNEARDAREVAKKLLKSGAIQVAKPDRSKDSTGFKRSRTLERKLSTTESRVGFQPFAANTINPPPNTPAATQPPEFEEVKAKPKIASLYSSFVSGGVANPTLPEPSPEKPKSGHTIYVHGYGLSEAFLKKSFAKFGSVVNISMELEKNCGFLTFDKTSCTERAINEANGTTIEGITLKVSLARRQPNIEPINDASSSTTWSTLASRSSQKGNLRSDERELVTYDEEIF